MTSDIFFISFRESNCEENWQRLLSLHPGAKRIHGVVGIDQVHLTCDTLSSTNYFWTVDGDNWVTKKLLWEPDCDLTMFYADDPLQKNLTLLGGVKLWRKGSIINPNMSKGDFSLNATKSKKTIEESFSETRYNDSPFDSWKTAFRHCVKLDSMIFRNRPNAKNIDRYLEQWKSCKNNKNKNADWAYRGYLNAIEYVKLYNNNLEQLQKINDYDWLMEYFSKHGTS